MTDNKNNIKGYSFAIQRKFCPDNPISVVQASGEDALEFLQGQFTQDISKLKNQDIAYGFLLTQKGRVFGDAHLRRLGAEDWQIISWSLTAAALIARLDAFIIADDVELADGTAGWRGWRIGTAEGGLAGSQAGVGPGDLVGLPVPAAVSMSWSYVIAPAKAAPQWADGWESASVDQFETVRIAAGWPQVTADLGPDDFPQEGGRHLAGVSFTKGCYLGQEVMARLAATGRVRRGLALVRGRGAAPAGEFNLAQGERKIGSLRSRVAINDGGWIGLAMLQLAHFEETQPFTDEAGVSVEFGGMVGAAE